MDDVVTKISMLIFTLVLSAIGAILFMLNEKVNTIETSQDNNIQYTVKIDQLRKESDDFEARLRIIEDSYLKEK